jgi:bifunctional DNA-binding transcriptional regulator/antitoxin component of YhaV-PrlF toxin-antitoxin module
VKIEIDTELDFDIEEGDMLIHIKHNGEINIMNQKEKERCTNGKIY